MKTSKKQFNVLVWDFNQKELVSYDVLPYFRKVYTETKNADRPVTKEQWEEFIRRKGMYMYWARCEYEFLVSEWPPFSDLNKDKHIKIDVWQQIENNLSIVVDLLMNEFNDCYEKI